MNRRRIDGDALLRALQVGGCSTTQTQQAVQVVVAQPLVEDSTCCTGPTNSVTLDASKFDQDDCPVLSYDIVNGDTEEQTLIIGGGPGRTGLFTIYGETANASDEPLVTTDGEPAVELLQFLALKGNAGGIVITGINVDITTDAGGTQVSKKLRRVSMGLDREICKKKIVKNICNVQCSTTDTDILQYDVCMITDTDHWLELPIAPGAAITLEVFYAGYGADVHNIRSCNGKVLSAVAA